MSLSTPKQKSDEHGTKLIKVKKPCKFCGGFIRVGRSAALGGKCKCLEALKVECETTKRAQRRARLEAFLHYGGPVCVCCGETELSFLAFDHINGNGAAHRRSVGAGGRMINWMKRNGYPKIFQVLCHNCNCAKHYLGECPHQTERTRQHAANDFTQRPSANSARVSEPTADGKTIAAPDQSVRPTKRGSRFTDEP